MKMTTLLFRLGAPIIRRLPNRPNKIRAVVALRWARIPADGLKVHEVVPGVFLELQLNEWLQRLYFLNEGDDAAELLAARETGLILDIGANIGFHTCALARRGNEVMAFEPLKANLVRLEGNVKLNRLSKVRIERCALSNRSGEVDIFVPPGWGLSTGAARLGNPGGWDLAETIPMQLLDDFQLRDVSLIKIDVEGHEIEVLRGFDIARWKPRLILLEDHVGNLSKHRYLLGAGYRIIRRYENNGWYVPRESAVKCGWTDRWEVVRKYYLALPFRVLRNFSRRLRKPITS